MTELRNIKVTAVGSVTNNGIDDATQTLQGIDYAHHKIHGGEHFYIKAFTTLAASGNTLSFDVTTPAGSKWAHMFWDTEGTTQTEYRVYEGGTLSGGTVVPTYNNNRNAGTTSVLTIKSNPTVSGASPTSGTLISSASRGLAGTPPQLGDFAGGQLKREDEFILKSGTSYLIEIKSVDSNNIIDYRALWYEHTDKVQVF